MTAPPLPDLLFFESITADQGVLVGGKGLSLGLMANAGLPVPPGFVITTPAYRRLHAQGVRAEEAFAQQLREAYHRLGAGRVAVRSSAIAEDSADASFAGQQETILGVPDEAALLDAVERCWQSLHTDRARHYRLRQGVADDQLAMAVVVQRLVNAEVAGVLFTRDPNDASGQCMLAEASWGLGEAVVSGKVTPDRFAIDRQTGEVRHRQRGVKRIRVTPEGEEPVPAELQDSYCLDDKALSALAELGRQVESFYGEARDVEWAYAEGRYYLLQARPITTATAVEREQVRQEVIASLKAKADPQGTVWARYNLSEVLPAPTPMTWAVVSRLLAADGGFGAMYRDLGMTPDPDLGSRSAFDLVAGRPMVNLSRLPRMQSPRPVFEYPFAQFKANPQRALDPQPVLNPLRGGVLRGLLRLPWTIAELARWGRAIRRAEQGFPQQFQALRVKTQALAASLMARDRSQDDPPSLLQQLNEAIQAFLAFARDSLKPTLFAQHAWQGLVELLKPKVGEEQARLAAGELSLGARPPEDADLAGAIEALGAGQLDRASFLARFGHRGPNEMELAQPRWQEQPEQLDLIVKQRPQAHEASGDPLARWDSLAKEAALTPAQSQQGREMLTRMRLYFGLREAGKNDLLRLYAVIRRILLELDQRFRLDGGIFFLTLDDLPGLLCGEDVRVRIPVARRRRQIELSLEVPAVVFSDDLEAIGRPPPELAEAESLSATPLSFGVAEGPALVLTEPVLADDDQGYILVCPSTDPGWVPLFMRAKGLVMEMGGVLSHGAIVAREFGLPAVAGLPDATRRLRTGQRLRVDGGRGIVTVLEPAASHELTDSSRR